MSHSHQQLKKRRFKGVAGNTTFTGENKLKREKYW